ncbi:DUF6473 family protein [Ruegeria lacuscaerulensis]|uniref:DUF6473 family protein n=1 Tax=Ruegeria lacuscaerulensis TaxID=55218 RepID=UPI001F206303|nr:DUF6473 family protein [Ruegeria lacuscaerulensis]
MSYYQTGSGVPEDAVCRYSGSRLWFRGPERSLDTPYMACIGGTETFGRFVETPFASVLEDKLDRRCLNLGSLFCGVDALCRDSGLQSLMDKAELCVLQAPDLLGQSNRFYRVHPRRNDRFLAATDDLISLYPDVDFADVNFVHHLMALLRDHQDARFEAVADELRRNWLKQMRALLEKLDVPVILLCLQVVGQSDGGDPADEADVPLSLGLLDAVRPFCAAIVRETVSVSGQSDELEDMLFGTLQQPMAEYMIGPAAHRTIAEALAGPIRDLR